jgi:hypothetical protein
MEILDGIPVPEITVKRAAKYPFDELEVGQCFVSDGGPTGSTSGAKVYHAMRRFMERDTYEVGEAKAREFKCRRMPGMPGKVGVWRIK